MTDQTPEPVERYDAWLLRRVGQAVEAGEVPAKLLTELQEEFQAAHGEPEKAVRAGAIRFVAELAGISPLTAAETLTALETQPEVMRTVMMRRLAEAWLERQRQAYRSRISDY